MPRLPTSDGINKRCYKCHERKPVTDFYRHPTNKDGLTAGCKHCMRELNRANRKAKADFYRAKERAKDKTKERARRMVRDRIARGVWSRRCCELCKLPNAEAHHDDYTKPLEVRWLCRDHHAELHRKENVEHRA